jgi:hypothetical protein
VSHYKGGFRDFGHIPYFGNVEPEQCRLAVDGLRAMNAPQSAEILEAAMTVYGPGGGPRNDPKRRRYDELTEEQRSLLDSLDDRYRRCPENVRMLLKLYVVDHPEAFRQPAM